MRGQSVTFSNAIALFFSSPMKTIFPLLFVVLCSLNWTCKKPNEVDLSFSLASITVGSVSVNVSGTPTTDVPVNKPILAEFNLPILPASAEAGVKLKKGTSPVEVTYSFLDNNKTVAVRPQENLAWNTNYTLEFTGDLKNGNNESFSGKTVSFSTEPATLHIDSIFIGSINATSINNIQNVSRNFSATVYFDASVRPESITNFAVRVVKSGFTAEIQTSLSTDGKILSIQSIEPLLHFERYQLILQNLQGTNDEQFLTTTRTFFSELDENPKFPVVSDDALMTLVQQQTFRYFWDFAHPVSGLIPERETTPNVCTIGGSGFGVMAIIVGIERGFISRQEGVERWLKIVNFLKDDAERFHGAWPHWLNGATGVTIPFSAQDNGADLVETSYMIQGLLTVREYLNSSDPVEASIIEKINTLWEEVEWSWFTRGGQDVLYWHWSPNLGWAMNHQIKGYNECLITYFLAACSPTYPIEADVYHNGWAVSPNFTNGSSYYGITLPLGYPYGGPLFFAHYSFLGLNPNGLTDTYADYWQQNINHSLINYAYCVDNPLNYVGYSERCWGLTASDNYEGYNAHSPTNDLGVISPTAALSSMPYTPEQSLAAMRFFYYTIGDKIWGEYGFTDAFSVSNGYYGTSYLAIDQGPILLMIENYRSQLCWNLFMSAPEVQVGKTLLGFSN
jgi:hypothetical protein